MPSRSGELAPTPPREIQEPTIQLIDPRGGPVVVVLAPDLVVRDAAAAGDALRAELRGLGASLVLGAADGYWRILPDDPIEPLTPELGARFAALVASTSDAAAPRLAVLVLDATGGVRFR